jgi:hypothetical protein
MWLFEDGRYDEAETIFLPILSSKRQSLDEGDPRQLQSISLVVSIYRT